MRPRLKDQPAYDARSLAILLEYESGGMPVANLAEKYGCASSTIWRRMQRARAQRANKDKTIEAMHRRIAELEARVAAMEAA